MGSHEGEPNLVCDFWDNRIAKALYSSHPSGNPMSHETQAGFNGASLSVASSEPGGIAPWATMFTSCWPRLEPAFRLAWLSRLFGKR